MIRLLDWFFLSRPIVLIPSWAFLFAGYLRGAAKAGREPDPWSELFPAFILFTFVLSGVYIVNQIFDVDSDRENGKLFLLAKGHVSIPAAWIIAAVLSGAALLGAIVWHPVYLPWLGASVLLGALYSIHPIRLKGKPVVDLLANAVGYGGIAFLFGYSLTMPVTAGVAIQTLPYMFIVAAVFLHTAIVDRPGDEKAGLRTSATFLGDRGASIAALLMLLATLISGQLVDEPYPSVAALCGIVFFLWAVIVPSRKVSTLSFQWCSLAFVFLIIISIPPFGLFLLALVIITRMYYKLRFKLTYPNLDF